MAEILPNAPLVKTVFEIRFTPNLFVLENKRLFVSSLEKDYPILGFPQNAHNIDPMSLPFRMVSEDNKTNIVFTPQAVAFTTSKYQGFKNFKTQALKALNEFVKNYKINWLTRLGLLYMNKIPIEVDKEGGIHFAKYLNLKLDLSEPAFGTEMIDLSASFIHKFGSDQLKTSIKPEASESNRFNIIGLNFDYFVNDKSKVGGMDGFLERSHDRIEKAFLNFTTTKYQKDMKGE